MENLEAILRIRTYLYNQGRCCKSLVVSEKMLKLFNLDMYGFEARQNNQDEENFNETIEFIPSM